MHKYPADTVATLEDFRRLDWKETVGAPKGAWHPSKWQTLSDAARHCIDEGRFPEAKVLWLLADVSSMMLEPQSIQTPFKPFAILEGRRSAIPEDLDEAAIDLLSEILLEIDERALQARIADIVWLQRRPRSVQYALLAIDAYRQAPLTDGTWHEGSKEEWERAIILTKMLREGAANRIEEIEATVLRTFESANESQGYFALWVSNLIYEQNLCRAQSTGIATKLRELSEAIGRTRDLRRAREYADVAAKWFARAGDKQGEASMIFAVAEGWAEEAVARSSTDSPSYMVSASFFEHALQSYRRVPRAFRDALKVEDRMTVIRASMADAGRRALGEMGVIRTPSINVTPLMAAARDAVRGKSIVDALAEFSQLYPGPNPAALRAEAEASIRQLPLQALFGVTHFSSDGRVIAQTPALSLRAADAAANDAYFMSQMIKNYVLEISIVAQASILPALQVIQQEHWIREHVLITIAEGSAIVPNGRERLFGKGLLAGFSMDFGVALHLLIPQVENLVRTHLKNAGAITSAVDGNGIETENGLSTLIDLPESEQVFGDSLCFEFRALFCSAFGPNLRNELAHGLLEDGALNSPSGLYAWWLCFRITYGHWWNRHQRQVQTAPELPVN